MPQQMWVVKYYVSKTGKVPAKQFIESLPTRVKSKIFKVFSYLVEFGPVPEISHLRKIANTKLWEVRILGKDNVRVFFVVQRFRKILILHGFIKKSQKTPQKEINIALRRAID